MTQDHGRGGESFEKIGKFDHHHRLGLGQRHEFQLRFEHDAEGAFRADHHFRQIDGLCGIGELVQVVAADAAQDFRIAAIDFGGVLGGEPRARSGNTRLRVFRPWGSRRVDVAEVRDASIGEHDGLFEHVVDGFSVKHAAGAGGIVGHHAADGGAAGGGDIGGETQAVGRELRVQFVEDDAGLDARPALLGVHFENAVVVFRNIDADAFADGLAGLRGAAAAHRDGAAKAATDFEDGKDVFARFWNDDAERFDLINAGVGGIERAGNLVEADFALDALRKLALQLLGRRGVGV